jgi:hypothetical protein
MMAIPFFFRRAHLGLLAAAALPSALTVTLGLPGVARADGASPMTTDACISANSKAQELRRDGKLAAARTELNRCVSRQCPGMVRNDCVRRLDEVDRVQPTLVFSAKDGDGNDVVAVKVSIDGQPLTRQLDGSALAVDPGTHTFTFELPGQPPVSRQLVVHESEKERLESVELGSPTAHPPSKTAATTTALASTPPPSDPHAGQGQRLSGFVLGGVGIAGLATGGVLGLMAMSAWNSSKNECGTVCPPANHSAAESDHDKAVTFGNVSTAAFAAGGALFVLGGVLVLTAPHARSGTAWSLSPRVGPGVADLTLKAAF